MADDVRYKEIQKFIDDKLAKRFKKIPEVSWNLESKISKRQLQQLKHLILSQKEQCRLSKLLCMDMEKF